MSDFDDHDHEHQHADDHEHHSWEHDPAHGAGHDDLHVDDGLLGQPEPDTEQLGGAGTDEGIVLDSVEVPTTEESASVWDVGLDADDPEPGWLRVAAPSEAVDTAGADGIPGHEELASWAQLAWRDEFAANTGNADSAPVPDAMSCLVELAHESGDQETRRAAEIGLTMLQAPDDSSAGARLDMGGP